MNPKPKPRVIDPNRCNHTVWGPGEGKWHGFNGCKLPPVVSIVRADGSVVASYCKRHTPKGNDSLVLVPFERKS